MTSTVYAWPQDSIDGVQPSYVGRSLRLASVAPPMGGAYAARPLGVHSGVRPGTPSSTVAVTSTAWTVHPCAGVIDPHLSSSAGAYGWALDSDVSGVLDAAHATYTRWDGLWVQIDDPAEGDGTDAPAARVVYVAGTAAASPAMPATPDRSLLLARIVVPAAGAGTPSAVWLAPVLAAAGAPIRVRSEAEAAALLSAYGASVEAPLWVEHIGAGNSLSGEVWRHNGSAWSKLRAGGAQWAATEQLTSSRTIGSTASPGATMVSGVYASAPAGIWEVIWVLCGSMAITAGTATLVGRVNGANLTTQSMNLALDRSLTQVDQFTHPGGTLTVALNAYASAATNINAAAGTRFALKYLGPI